jgi:transposase
MKKLIIGVKNAVEIVEVEIKRNEEARYGHRLHAVMLVARGMSCRRVAQYFKDSQKTVTNWVHQFNNEGLMGLQDREGRGRKKTLTEAQEKQLGRALRKTPRDAGIEANLWDGKTISAYVKKFFKVELGVRQCQRLLRQLNFRLRKPRPIIGSPDPEKRELFKKNS